MSSLLHTPVEVADIAVRHLENLQNSDQSRGIQVGISRIDQYLTPLQPGELCVIMGRPGMGKSVLMAHYARMAGYKVANLGYDVGVPVVVTAEMSIEDYQVREVSHFSGVDSSLIRRGDDGINWDHLKNVAMEVKDKCPIVYIGHTFTGGGRRPSITMEKIEAEIEKLHEGFGVAPSLICLDYLQRLKLDVSTRDRRMDMSEIVEKSKDMGLRFGIPIVLGVQAGRAVDDRVPPVPRMSDGKETGNIEETADIVMGVFRPSRVYSVGEPIPNSSGGLICEDNLFLISVLKQRGGESGKSFWVSFDMSITRLADLEIRSYNLTSQEETVIGDRDERI